jgi:hypothetical protein
VAILFPTAGGGAKAALDKNELQFYNLWMVESGDFLNNFRFYLFLKYLKIKICFAILFKNFF